MRFRVFPRNVEYNVLWYNTGSGVKEVPAVSAFFIVSYGR
jgi:hypothetical protein